MANYISTRIFKHRESPDVITKRMKQIEMEGSVSTYTIYKYIGMGLILSMTNETLLEKQKRSKKPTKKLRHLFKRLPKSESIEKRQEHIDDRQEFGHGEMDLVVEPMDGLGFALLTQPYRHIYATLQTHKNIFLHH